MKIQLHLLIFIFVTFSCSMEDDQKDISSELIDISERLNPTQTFEINPKTDTVVEGRLGTRIFIPANSLIFENGEQPTSKITLRLKEVYSISDMILNGLSTTTNGQLLETSGMINLNASINGETLSLKPDKPIKIQFKNITSAPFMRTYLGEYDSTGINWALDENNFYDTIRFNEPITYILTLDYGADSVFSAIANYAIVANDTIQLNQVQFEVDTTIIDSISYYDEPFYEIHATDLGWINCDFFINSNDNINVIANKLEETKTLNYLVFQDYYSIMSSWVFEGNNSVFRNIPRGSKVIAIGIAKKDSDYYLAMHEVILETENQQIKLDYKKASIENISTKLEELEY